MCLSAFLCLCRGSHPEASFEYQSNPFGEWWGADASRCAGLPLGDGFDKKLLRGWRLVKRAAVIIGCHVLTFFVHLYSYFRVHVITVCLIRKCCNSLRTLNLHRCFKLHQCSQFICVLLPFMIFTASSNKDNAQRCDWSVARGFISQRGTVILRQCMQDFCASRILRRTTKIRGVLPSFVSVCRSVVSAWFGDLRAGVKCVVRWRWPVGGLQSAGTPPSDTPSAAAAPVGGTASEAADATRDDPALCFCGKFSAPSPPTRFSIAHIREIRRNPRKTGVRRHPIMWFVSRKNVSQTPKWNRCVMPTPEAALSIHFNSWMVLQIPLKYQRHRGGTLYYK